MGSYGDVLSHFNESGALSGDVVSRSEAEELSVRVAELEDEVRGASLPLPLPNPRKASSFSQIVFGGGGGFLRCSLPFCGERERILRRLLLRVAKAGMWWCAAGGTPMRTAKKTRRANTVIKPQNSKLCQNVAKNCQKTFAKQSMLTASPRQHTPHKT
jgi:hypothetical protein